MMREYKIFLKEDKIINYIHDALDIKMTKEKGRGIFATEFIMKGTLLIVERAIAESEENGEDETLICKCSNLLDLKGVKCLRLCTLSFGTFSSKEILYVGVSSEENKIP